MMKGGLDFLLSDDDGAVGLRRGFIFKVVPMLNVDGVVEGNHRCGLSGVDLNRQWLNPDPKVHPTIFWTKQMLLHIRSNMGKDVTLFCDLHGHFRKKNVFMFGCDHSGKERLMERVFPHLLAQLDDNFSSQGSSYKILKSKRACGRVVVGKDLSVINSFTMEASFSGMDIGSNKGFHIDTRMLEGIGKHLCQVLIHYLEPSRSVIHQTHQTILKMDEEEIKEESTTKKKTKKKKIRNATL